MPRGKKSPLACRQLIEFLLTATCTRRFFERNSATATSSDPLELPASKSPRTISILSWPIEKRFCLGVSVRELHDFIGNNVFPSEPRNDAIPAFCEINSSRYLVLFLVIHSSHHHRNFLIMSINHPQFCAFSVGGLGLNHETICSSNQVQ
jgi:hypothetical protein